MLEDLTFKSLGVVNYHETLELMKSHIKKDDFNNEIWLLEHPPIFTLGTAADKNHILNAKDIPIVQSDRGGEVTYHGPGQIVIYFLLDDFSLKTSIIALTWSSDISYRFLRLSMLACSSESISPSSKAFAIWASNIAFLWAT